MKPLDKKKAYLENAMKMIVKNYTEKNIYTDRDKFDFDELEEKQRVRGLKIYEDTPVYKKMTSLINYNEDLHLENIDIALHPSKSPLPPANLTRELQEKQEQDLAARLNEERKKLADAYSVNVPLADEFVTRQQMKEKKHFE